MFSVGVRSDLVARQTRPLQLPDQGHGKGTQRTKDASRQTILHDHPETLQVLFGGLRDHHGAVPAMQVDVRHF